MKVVILAAGSGRRLGGGDLPKPLTVLQDGSTILGRQVALLSQYFPHFPISIIVGFHQESIREVFPKVNFIENPNYAHENTAKSLLRALKVIDDDVLWMNGDVVFHPSVLQILCQKPSTSMIVNRGRVGEEEVKYCTNSEGNICAISKEIKKAEGEALGINLFMKKDLEVFKRGLEQCGEHDYFEKGIEYAIHEGVGVKPFVIDANLCTEVDFAEDLLRANALLEKWKAL